MLNVAKALATLQGSVGFGFRPTTVAAALNVWCASTLTSSSQLLGCATWAAG